MGRYDHLLQVGAIGLVVNRLVVRGCGEDGLR